MRLLSALRQLRKVCVSLCLPTWKCRTNVYLVACWEVEEVHLKVLQVFEKEREEQNIFSLQTYSCKVYVKWVFLLALLSKKRGFPLHCKVQCMLHLLLYDKPFQSLEMWASFLFKERGLDFIHYFLFEQRVLKIIVLTSIFSFDYKHMSGALKLTFGWDTNYVFQAWAQFTLCQEIILNSSVFSLDSYLKSNFKNTKACKITINQSH